MYLCFVNQRFVHNFFLILTFFKFKGNLLIDANHFYVYVCRSINIVILFKVIAWERYLFLFKLELLIAELLYAGNLLNSPIYELLISLTCCPTKACSLTAMASFH